MSPRQTDLRTRIGELEATVSGLTQELVEANERIRQLEAAVEAGETDGRRRDEPGVGEAEDEAGDGGSTKQMSDETEADEEASSDLDGIIVA